MTFPLPIGLSPAWILVILFALAYAALAGVRTAPTFRGFSRLFLGALVGAIIGQLIGQHLGVDRLTIGDFQVLAASVGAAGGLIIVRRLAA